MSAIAAANSSSVTAVGADAATLAGKAVQRNAAPAIDANQSDTGRGPAWFVTVAPRTNVSQLQASLDALRPALSEDLAESLTEQLQKASDALTTLDQARSSVADNRKADAEQKLEQARKKLQLLRMLGGDPASVARQARAIAQEIKAAASEYSSAVKSEGAGAATAAAATMVGSTSPATEASATATDPAAAGPISAAATGAPPDPSGDLVDHPTSIGTAAAAPTAATPADQEATRQKNVQAYQAAVDGASAKAGRIRGEQEVLEKFKDAAREVKQVIEEAARKLRAQHLSDPDADAASQAGTAMDQAIRQLSEVMQAGSAGGSLDISIGSIAVAMPALDIQA